MRLSYLYSIVIVSGVVLCGLSEAQEAWLLEIETARLSSLWKKLLAIFLAAQTMRPALNLRKIYDGVFPTSNFLLSMSTICYGL